MNCEHDIECTAAPGVCGWLACNCPDCQESSRQMQQVEQVEQVQEQPKSFYNPGPDWLNLMRKAYLKQGFLTPKQQKVVHDLYGPVELFTAQLDKELRF